MDRRGRPRHPDILTPREWEVLELLRKDLANSEIADRIGISERGVKYHVSEIMGKLGVRDRREAARWRPDADETPRQAPLWAAITMQWRGIGHHAAVLSVFQIAEVATPRSSNVRKNGVQASAEELEREPSVLTCFIEDFMLALPLVDLEDAVLLYLRCPSFGDVRPETADEFRPRAFVCRCDDETLDNLRALRALLPP